MSPDPTFIQADLRDLTEKSLNMDLDVLSGVLTNVERIKCLRHY